MFEICPKTTNNPTGHKRFRISQELLTFKSDATPCAQKDFFECIQSYAFLNSIVRKLRKRSLSNNSIGEIRENIFHLFQLMLSVFTIVVNLHCILAVVFVKSIRKAEFYLVFLQSLFDFFCSGLLSTFYNAVMAGLYVDRICYFWEIFQGHYFNVEMKMQTVVERE